MFTFNKTRKRIAASVCAMALSLTLGFSSVSSLLRANAEESTKQSFYTDFATWEEEQDAASDLNVKIAGEGAVLLKNRAALPLSSSEKSVSVFGDHSDNILQAGGGAGGGSSSRSKTLQDSMIAAGFKMNPVLYGYYKAHGNPANESDPKELDAYKGSFTAYGDAAIIVFSRTGSEMSDIVINADSTKNGGKDTLAGHSNPDDHSLMLEDNERGLVEYVKASGAFDKIIIVLNTPAPMEIAELEDDDAVSAILWIGLTGADGIMALGQILNGEVNPSGRLVDVYAAKFDTEPTWFNVSDASHVNASTYVTDSTGKVYEIPGIIGGRFGGPNYASLDYEEGIYSGYKYFETVYDVKDDAGKTTLELLATTDVGEGKNVYGKDVITSLSSYAPANDMAGYATDDVYYNRYNGVLYPFGYGMSYTNFKWTLKSTDALTVTDATKNDKITIEVEVENVGDRAGKDVVELYSEPAYYQGGIEKATKNLVNYVKTRNLQPGEKQTVKISFTPFDLASFDDVDANGNGFCGYELEAGAHKLYISKNSHEVVSTVTLNVGVSEPGAVMTTAATKGSNGIAWKNDPTTGTEITALFSQDDKLKDEEGVMNNQFSNTRRPQEVMAEGGEALEFMSRADLVATFPDAPTAKDVCFNDDAIKFLDDQRSYNSYLDKETDKWYKDSVPEGWTQAAERKEGDVAEIQLYDMVGVPITDDKWVAFMNQLTFDEMRDLISATGFKTPALDVIGKPQAKDADGAGQLSKGTFWVGAVLLASTWNVDLAEMQGIMVGNESLFQNVQGWYGPSMNTHRSPFSGRNFEYYSQDGVQAAKIAASVVKGARSKGVVTYIKHFALNDQEQNRQINGGVITWCSEQAMRENYLRPFEAAIKEGGANATMGSFNRIGMMPSVNDYDFYVSLTTEEWGLIGYSITDMYAGGSTYWPGNIMCRAGTGPLGNYSGKLVIEGTWDAEKNAVMVPSSAEENATLVESPTHYYAVRNTAMRLLYVAANSNLLGNGNKLPLSAFAEGTQPAVAGGWGSTGQKEIRKVVDGLTVGEKITDIQIGLTDEQKATLQDGAGNRVTYSIVEGELPAGLKYDTRKNIISGTPTESGEFKITFRATLDRYITSDKLLTIVVSGEDVTVVDPLDELTEKVEGLETELGDIKEALKKVLTEAQIKELIAASKGLSEDEVKALITDALKANDTAKEETESSGGCGGNVYTDIFAIATILAAAGVVCSVKAKRRNDK